MHLLIAHANFESLNECLRAHKGTIFVLCDHHTIEVCFPIFIKECPASYHTIVIPSGEAHKNMATCEYIWQQLLNFKADKNTLLINLGGGVLSDLGGFAAAAYKRGIQFINVPTTLMGMVDAAYGGKTGVNFGHLKNMIGVFKQPQMLIIHTPFLKTLPLQHIKNGFAEMLKHALLSNDEALDELLSLQDLSLHAIEPLIDKSLAVKQNIVAQDPLEMGLRKVLNLGHTVGHAIEYAALSDRHELMHGEAVALGLKAMLKLSELKMNMASERVAKIISFIDKHYPAPHWLEASKYKLLEAVQHDKKNNNAQINMVLLTAVGKPKIDVACSVAELEAAVKFL